MKIRKRDVIHRLGAVLGQVTVMICVGVGVVRIVMVNVGGLFMFLLLFRRIRRGGRFG